MTRNPLLFPIGPITYTFRILLGLCFMHILGSGFRPDLASVSAFTSEIPLNHCAPIPAPKLPRMILPLDMKSGPYDQGDLVHRLLTLLEFNDTSVFARDLSTAINSSTLISRDSIGGTFAAHSEYAMRISKAIFLLEDSMGECTDMISNQCVPKSAHTSGSQETDALIFTLSMLRTEYHMYDTEFISTRLMSARAIASLEEKIVVARRDAVLAHPQTIRGGNCDTLSQHSSNLALIHYILGALEVTQGHVAVMQGILERMAAHFVQCSTLFNQDDGNVVTGNADARSARI